jgi:hypothetical protein
MRYWLTGYLFPAMQSLGYTGALVTLTLRHSEAEPWSAVPADFQRAYRKCMDRVRPLLRRLGVPSAVSSAEYTVGPSGLHYHRHLLIPYLRSMSPEEVAELRDALHQSWLWAVARVGRDAHSVHGFDFKPDAVSTYVAKVDVSYEVASQSTKVGRRTSSRSMFQLLDAANRGDRTAADAWFRAFQALQGSRRFESAAVAAAFGIPPWSSVSLPSPSVDAPGDPDDCPRSSAGTCSVEADPPGVCASAPVDVVDPVAPPVPVPFAYPTALHYRLTHWRAPRAYIAILDRLLMRSEFVAARAALQGFVRELDAVGVPEWGSDCVPHLVPSAPGAVSRRSPPNPSCRPLIGALCSPRSPRAAVVPSVAAR